MHIFFSVGEPSGDQHAAELMREFERCVPGTRFSGLGGPEMQAQGLECIYQLTDLAVMGIRQVLPLVKKFYGIYQQTKAYLKEHKPDAVVLVDFPGFNWWIASAAKEAGIPVYYYCPPQLWAWAPWRIRKVRKYVDTILAVHRFEEGYYKERGVDVKYVGHPFFDEVAAHSLDVKVINEIQSKATFNMAILPGSRKQEVNNNFPSMLGMIEKLSEQHPHVRFPVACYKQWHYDRCQELLLKSGLPVDLYMGKTSEVIEAADCCLMVSGSVSLELLARKTPTAVIYRGGPLLYVFAKCLLTVKYLSLPNLIAGRELMPELPFVRKQSRHVDRMIALLDSWISSPEELRLVKQAMSDLAEDIVKVGGVERAAKVLVERLCNSETPLRKAA